MKNKIKDGIYLGLGLFLVNLGMSLVLLGIKLVVGWLQGQ